MRKLLVQIRAQTYKRHSMRAAEQIRGRLTLRQKQSGGIGRRVRLAVLLLLARKSRAPIIGGRRERELEFQHPALAFKRNDPV